MQIGGGGINTGGKNGKINPGKNLDGGLKVRGIFWTVSRAHGIFLEKLGEINSRMFGRTKNT